MTIPTDQSAGAAPSPRRFVPSTRLLSGLLASAIALFFSGVLIWHLVQEFRTEHILEQLHQVPPGRFALALLFAALGYLTMTAYDTLGFLWVGRTRTGHLPYRKIALACFCGYSVSNTLGFASVTGTAVRLRLYSAWGVRVTDVLHVVAFSASTTWFGLCVLAGSALVADPHSFDARLPVNTVPMWRATGALLLGCPVVYLALCARWGGSALTIKGREVALPRAGIAAAQIAVATTDWVLAGLVLYALLPDIPTASFFDYIASFSAAQGAGIASHVPGGAGVFEATLLALLKGAGYPVPAILVAIVGFRVVYYLIPFTIACVILAGREMLVHGRGRGPGSKGEVQD